MASKTVIASALIAMILTACARLDEPQTFAPLPSAPGDIVACFDEPGLSRIPDRDLTVADVERLWAQDRLRAIALQRCGERLLAWFDNIRD